MTAGGSFWMDSADGQTPRPPPRGTTEADIAILGAGFTGLWTAWYLLRREPSLRVVVVDAEVVGFGGSGRNGGWCSAAIGVTPTELARRTSADVSRVTYEALRDTVDEVGRVCAAEGIDAQFRKGGVLRIARGSHEVPSVHATLQQLDALQLADGCALLSADELAGRVRVARAEAALFDPHCAVLHPGRLVHGLADAVERAGGVIHERTVVRRVSPRRRRASSRKRPDRRPALHTDGGTVRADTVVLAGEAYLSQLSGTRRAVLPLYSLVVLTEPLSDEQWRAVGWEGHECLSSRRYTVDYLSRTADGRVLFGGRGAPYHFGSAVAEAYDRHEPTHAQLRDQLVDWFPQLDGIGFTHAWGGPVGTPRDWMPTFRHDPASGLAGAYGYTGQGVAAANLAGRTLADLITGVASPLVDLPMVNHRSPRWEPEPLRWLATRYLQAALARIDHRASETGVPPSGRTFAERLVQH